MIEKINKLIFIKINNFWEFPAGSVVRIRHVYSCGLSSTSQAKWHSRKKSYEFLFTKANTESKRASHRGGGHLQSLPRLC